MDGDFGLVIGSTIFQIEMKLDDLNKIYFFQKVYCDSFQC